MNDLIDVLACCAAMLGLSLIKNFRLFSYSDEDQIENVQSEIYLIITFSHTYCFPQLIDGMRVQYHIHENLLLQYYFELQ